MPLEYRICVLGGINNYVMKMKGHTCGFAVYFKKRNKVFQILKTSRVIKRLPSALRNGLLL